MAVISNMYMTRMLGGKWWKIILRTGYLAVILVLAHVVLLKSARWMRWYQDGMETFPSLSLLVSVFMVIVVLMRIALWMALKKRDSHLK